MTHSRRYSSGLRGFLRRRSAITKKLLLLVTSLLLIAGLAEGALRLLGLGVPAGLLYEFDELCGMRLAANYSGWQTREGRVYVTTNEHGQRDHPRPIPKPADTFRVAVLGDSYAEALQVEINQTFWSVAERQLNAAQALPEQRVEFMNFGVSGYGTAQEYLTLHERVWQFEPDLILLAFLPYNDVRNNSRDLEPETYRPFYRLDGDQLRLDTSAMDAAAGPQTFRNSKSIRLKHFLIKHVRLCGLIYEFRERRRQAAAAAAAQTGTKATEVGLDDQVYTLPTPEWQQAWEVTERLIVRMQQEAAAHDAAFAVMVVTAAAQVDPDPERTANYAARLGVDNLSAPETRVQALAIKHSFPVTRLTERMQDYARTHQRYLHGFENTQLGTGHWNVTGHRVAGESLAEDWIANGILRGEPQPINQP